MSLTTIVSYPERGHWGNNKWRGNCSGKMVMDLLDHFRPKKVLDPMVGSGTTLDVCREKGVKAVGLDLNPAFGGWDALNDDVPEGADFIFWHPPYHDIIKYSGHMWGTEPDPRDLSRCATYEEFIEKLDKIQEKLFYSLRRGGRIAILVGDIKRKGVLYSMQKDMRWYGTPEQVIIKVQHNYASARNNYGGRFIPIVHEYLLIFRKGDSYLFQVRGQQVFTEDIRNKENVTWRDVVYAALDKLGGEAPLAALYEEVKGHRKTYTNGHWQAKVRQILQLSPDFEAVAPGKWRLAAA